MSSGGLLRISVLGPLNATLEGEIIQLGGRLQRLTLAALVASYPEPLSKDVLIDQVWGGASPEAASNSLQAYISRLRRLLGSDVIERGEHGYRLAVDADSIDAEDFRRTVAEAEQLKDTEAGPRMETLLRSSLAAWRGTPYGELGYEEFLKVEVAELDRLREAATGWLYESLLDEGISDSGLITDMERSIARNPFNERLRAQLARALYQLGRRAEAVAVLDRAQLHLADELGVEPSEELVDLREQILAADPTLEVTLRNNRQQTALPAESNLRVVGTSFHGRSEIVADVCTALSQGEVVTLTGPGGVGKSRIAIEVACSIGPDVEAVWKLSLLGAVSVKSAAADLAVRIGAGATRLNPVGALADRLQNVDGLVVIDNAEHMLVDVAELVDRLRMSCPNLRILITSRESLGLADEREIKVPPFGSTNAGSPAIELFAARARQARPGFRIRPSDDRFITSVIEQLGGLPIGIEIAAAQLRLVSLSQLESSVEGLNEAVIESEIEGHESLAALIDWSTDLLDPSSRRRLEELAVFAGGFDEKLAGSLWDLTATAAGQLLDELVAASLVVRGHELSSTQYRLLEPTRSHLIGQLTRTDRCTEVEERLDNAVMNRLIAVESAQHGRGQAEALAMTRAIWPDVHAAASRADTSRGNRIIEIAWYWAYLDGRLLDVLDLLRTVADNGVSAVTPLAQAIEALAGGEIGLLSEVDVVELCRDLGDGQPLVQLVAGDALTFVGCYDHAEPLLVEAQRVYADLGIGWGEGWAALRRVRIEGLGRGDDAAARELLQRALTLLSQSGDEALVGYGELIHASIARVKGRWGPMFAAAERAVAVFDNLGLGGLHRDAAFFMTEAAIRSLDVERSRTLCNSTCEALARVGNPADSIRITLLRAEHAMWNGDAPAAIAELGDLFSLQAKSLIALDKASLSALMIDAALVDNDLQLAKQELGAAAEVWAALQHPWARLLHDFQSARIDLALQDTSSAEAALVDVAERGGLLGECHVVMRSHDALAAARFLDGDLLVAFEHLFVADALRAPLGGRMHPAEKLLVQPVRKAAVAADRGDRLVAERNAHTVAEAILAVGPLY